MELSDAQIIEIVTGLLIPNEKAMDALALELGISIQYDAKEMARAVAHKRNIYEIA